MYRYLIILVLILCACIVFLWAPFGEEIQSETVSDRTEPIPLSTR